MEPKPVQRGIGAAYNLGFADGRDYERRRELRWVIPIMFLSFIIGATIF